jgi:hypothetical protein
MDNTTKWALKWSISQSGPSLQYHYSIHEIYILTLICTEKHKINVLRMLVLKPLLAYMSIYVFMLCECWYKFYAMFMKATVYIFPFE